MDTTPKTVSYFDPDLLISLRHPEDWLVARNEQFPLILLAPAEDNYRASLTFQQSSLEPPTPERMEELIVASHRQQLESFSEFKFLDDNKFVLDGCPAYLKRIEWSDPKSGRRFSQVQVLILVGPGRFYSIDASSLQPLAGDWLPRLTEVIESVRFIPPRPTEPSTQEQSEN